MHNRNKGKAGIIPLLLIMGSVSSFAVDIGNYVWWDQNKNGIQEAGEPGIANAYVKLRNGTTNRKVQAVRTDANGQYSFKNVPAGKYYIQFYKPTGFVAVTGKNQGNNDNIDSDGGSTGKTPKFNAVAGTNLDFDMGYQKPKNTKANIGDFVWWDQNSNGVQDAGEPGIANAYVKLRSAATGRKVQAMRTDANGKYLFTNISAGQYYIQYYKPTGYLASAPKKQGGNTSKDSDGGSTGKTKVFTVTTANNLDMDMGFTKNNTPQGNFAIGDQVWNDTDKDGIQNNGEPGLSNATITLYNAAGTKLKSTKSDANGKYVFKKLAAGNYTVTITKPTGYINSTPTSKTVTLNSNLANVDFGLYSGTGPGNTAIGDLVWWDQNSNGIQDAGEPGIPNVYVKLRNGTTRKKVQATKTDANGKYTFLNVPNGQYYIQYYKPATYLAATARKKGTNGAKDSDGSTSGKTSKFTINGTSNLNLDMGYTKQKTSNANIGDYIWNDANGDGIQDANEKGIANVKVKLRNGTTRKTVGTTRTDANGKYLFTNIPAGQYYIQVYKPTGFNAVSPKRKGGNTAKDSDAGKTGKTSIFTVTKANNLNFDIGYSNGGGTQNCTINYRNNIVHFADEHDPHNRMLTIDYKNMKLLKAVPVEGSLNHHADTLGLNSKANYTMLVAKGSKHVTIRDIKSGNFVKKINLPFRPRSGDAYNKVHNLVLLNSRDRPSAVLINPISLKLVGKAGFNTTCNKPKIVAPYAGLYAAKEIQNLKCNNFDFGGDQISGHPIWLSSTLFALIDRSNRLLHVYSIAKNGAKWNTTLVQTLKTDTSLHQIIAKDTTNPNNVTFFGSTEGNLASKQAPGVYKFTLQNGKLVQTSFTKLNIPNLVIGYAGHNIYITPDKKFIYSPAGGTLNGTANGGVFVLDSTTMKIITFVPAGAGAGHVAFSKQRGIAIVTNHKAKFLTAINYKKHTFIKNIPVSYKVNNWISLFVSHSEFIESTGRYYYNFWSDGGVFFRIDLANLTLDKSIPVGGVPIQGNFFPNVPINCNVAKPATTDGYNELFPGWITAKSVKSSKTKPSNTINGYDDGSWNLK